MLYYITSNESKIKNARTHLSIQFEIKELDIQEIQAESLEEIADDKAKKAFEILKQPLFVNDHAWYIPTLNGFPGPFMHYMNQWLTANDFLNLMLNKEDRSVILHEVICYIDQQQIKTFIAKYNGTILHTPQGEGRSFDKLANFTNDGKSMAQRVFEGKNPLPTAPIWNEFAEWYSEKRVFHDKEGSIYFNEV